MAIKVLSSSKKYQMNYGFICITMYPKFFFLIVSLENARGQIKQRMSYEYVYA